MSIKESIGWCDLTLNPVKGKCPVACPYCYARKMYDRFRWNPEIRFVPSVFDTLPQKPSRVFVGSTIELLLFDDWMEFILNRCQDFPQHTFQFLTKKPEKLPQWNPFPDNCQVGVTVTDRLMWFNAIWQLQDVKATVKFLSFEPLLNWQHLDKEPIDTVSFTADWFRRAGINQVIIGACTGTKPDLLKLQQQYPDLTLMPYGRQWTAQPQIEWVEEIVRAADQAGVKVFLKDNLKPMFGIMTTKEASELPTNIVTHIEFISWCDEEHKLKVSALRQELLG